MIPMTNRLALRLVIGIGCALLLALLIHDRNRWKARTIHYAELLAGERAAHSATAANVRAAAERARRQDADNAERVKTVQAAINERSAHEYESRIAAARAAAERVRRDPEANAADPGGRGAAAMSGLPASSGGSAQAAGEDRFPDARRLIATEQAIQLDELISWVERQHAVDPNGKQSVRR